MTENMKFTNLAILNDFHNWAKKNEERGGKIRFGQWFVNNYCLTDSKLFYMVDPKDCLHYVFENYCIKE